MKTLSTLLVALLSISLNAQLLLEENFDYNLGALEGQGGWSLSTNASWQGASSPIVTAESLVFSNYIGSGKSNSVSITGSSRISYKQFSSGGINTGSVYAAFLVKILSTPNNIDFFMFDAGTGSAPRAKVFVTNSNEKIKFGISMNDLATKSTLSDELSKEDTYLLVLKYTFVSGTSNDIVELFINPVPGASEESQISKKLTAPVEADMAMIKSIDIRQRGTNAYIGGIRVGNSWADVVKSDVINTNSDFSDAQNKGYSIHDGIIRMHNADVNSINIYNLKGVLMRNSPKSVISISDLAKGIYVLQYKNTNGESVKSKIFL